MKPRNFVSKHMRQFNKPSVVQNKRRQAPPSRVACLLDEIASECDKMQVKEGIELIDEHSSQPNVEEE